jgi:hypothetical protein
MGIAVHENRSNPMKLLMIINILMSFATTIALAGPGERGGGGKGVVCRDKSGRIESVQLLDLWESQVLFSRPARISKEPIERQITRALEQLKNSVAVIGLPTVPETEINQQLSRSVQRFVRDRKMLHGVTLTLTPDSYEVAYPTQCSIEQIVTYIDGSDPQILVNADLWEKLDTTNKAALIVHEASYSLLRLFFDEKDSVRVRRAVGYVFAGNYFSSLKQILPPRYVVCEANLFQDQVSPSKIYFMRGPSDKVGAITAYHFGEPSIGFFFPKQGFTGIGLEELADGGSCQTGLTMTYGATSSGPVDFNIPRYVRFICENNKWKVYATKDLQIRQSSRTDSDQLLVCRLEEK